MKERKRKKGSGVSAYLFAWMSQAQPGLQSRPQLLVQAALSVELRQVASAWLFQGDFKSQFPEPWDSRESSRAACSACGVKNKPLPKGTGCKLPTRPPPALWSRCQLWLAVVILRFLCSINGSIPSTPLAPPIVGSLPCDELSQLADQTAAQSAFPLTQTLDWPCSVIACPAFWSSCSWIPTPAVRSHCLSNHPIRQFD